MGLGGFSDIPVDRNKGAYLFKTNLHQKRANKSSYYVNTSSYVSVPKKKKD
jgi:hypothetical protein